MDYRDVEERIRRLPIDGSNLREVNMLANLPYDHFRPIMDELLYGELTLRDLRPALRRALRAWRAVPATNPKGNARSLLTGGPVGTMSYRDRVAEDDERAAIAEASGVPTSLVRSIAVEPIVRIVTRDLEGQGVEAKAKQVEDARILDAAKLTEKLNGA